MAIQFQPEDGHLDIDGLRLHYVDWGNAGAQPLVLLHGLQDCARSWDFLAAQMRTNYHILALDPDAVNPDSQGMFHRYHSEPDEWESLEAVVERLRSRQPNSYEEVLTHQALYMTRELPDGTRVWKRDRKLLEGYERPDLWAEWSQIRCPTLILRGRQSNLLTHEVAVRMREAIPRARLAELEGGGHWFYQESPEAFETTVRWFLENPPE